MIKACLPFVFSLRRIVLVLIVLRVFYVCGVHSGCLKVVGGGAKREDVGCFVVVSTIALVLKVCVVFISLQVGGDNGVRDAFITRSRVGGVGSATKCVTCVCPGSLMFNVIVFIVDVITVISSYLGGVPC